MSENKPKSVNFIRPQQENVQKKKKHGTFNITLITLLLGVLLGVFGILLIGYSEGLDFKIRTIKQLSVQNIDKVDVSEDKEKIALRGEPEVFCNINVPDCDENLLYYKKIREELQGDVWVTVRSDEGMANFSIGEISVIPKQADLVFRTEEKSRTEGEEEINGEIIKYREITNGISNTEEISIYGRLTNKTIKDGDLFIISNMDKEKLVDYYDETMSTERYIYKIAAMLLLTFSLVSIILPIIAFLEIIPGLGWLVTIIVFVISFLISAIFVFLTTLFIRYWWMVFVLIGVVAALLIIVKIKKSKTTVKFIP